MAIILCRGTVVQSSKAFVCQCHNGPIMFFSELPDSGCFQPGKNLLPYKVCIPKSATATVD